MLVIILIVQKLTSHNVPNRQTFLVHQTRSFSFRQPSRQSVAPGPQQAVMVEAWVRLFLKEFQTPRTQILSFIPRTPYVGTGTRKKIK